MDFFFFPATSAYFIACLLRFWHRDCSSEPVVLLKEWWNPTLCTIEGCFLQKHSSQIQQQEIMNPMVRGCCFFLPPTWRLVRKNTSNSDFSIWILILYIQITVYLTSEIPSNSVEADFVGRTKTQNLLSFVLESTVIAKPLSLDDSSTFSLFGVSCQNFFRNLFSHAFVISARVSHVNILHFPVLHSTGMRCVKGLEAFYFLFYFYFSETHAVIQE